MPHPIVSATVDHIQSSQTLSAVDSHLDISKMDKIIL